MGFIDEIKTKAKADLKTIVLPETEDVRTYEAAEAILKEGTAKLVLIGSEEEVAKNKGNFDISTDCGSRKEREDGELYREAGRIKTEEGYDRGAGKRASSDELPVLRRDDGEDGGRGWNGFRCLSLYSRYLASVFTDPEDETGHQARIRIFYHGSAGLRDGGEWYIRIRRLRSKPESQSLPQRVLSSL